MASKKPQNPPKRDLYFGGDTCIAETQKNCKYYRQQENRILATHLELVQI